VTRTKVGRRKLRLLACGCCRLAWGQMSDPRLKSAVELAERFVEGQATKAELEAAQSSIVELTLRSYERDAPGVLERSAAGMVFGATQTQPLYAALGVVPSHVPFVGYAEEAEAERIVCELVRCVFGNPFRTQPTSDPALLSWNNGIVVKLAQAIYDERELPSGILDSARLAVLADALEEAGCTNQDMLSHCRNGGTHIRGCWAVDLLLGKQ
jgi:hypothetical protein